MATMTAAVFKEDDLYVAKCLDNDIVSQGTTVPEALANLQEALELFYDDSAPPETAVVAVNTLQIRGQSP